MATEKNIRNTFLKSPMNYTGGKHKLLPQLIPLIQGNDNDNSKPIRNFIDLFTGGANVVINIHPTGKRIANDIDSRLIGIYKTFQSHSLEEIINHIESRIKEFNLSQTNKEGYLKLRELYNNGQEEKDKNPLDLFTLICYSFNNQIRFNSKSQFNIPFGERSFNSSTRNKLQLFHQAIQDITFLSLPFQRVNLLDNPNVTNEDYVYCDPPYLITCASYNENGGWGEKEEKELLSLMDSLNERNIRFGLSNVFQNKGKRNELLIEWCNKNNYTVHHLNHSYSNCSYHAKDRESITDEVFITNQQ